MYGSHLPTLKFSAALPDGSGAASFAFHGEPGRIWKQGTPTARWARKARGLSQIAQPPGNSLKARQGAFAVMSRILRTKKSRVGIGAVVVLAAMAAAAIAYWTSSGEGSGTVKASAGSTPFEVSSGLVEGLYPGGSSAVTVKVKNTDASQNEYLTKLEAEVTETSVAECKKEWFEVTPASQEPKVLVTHGETKEYAVNLKMKEEAAVNQDACKGASVTVHYKAS